jgi:hypothetical protein
MRQPKQKRSLMRRATITLAAIAAGSLPMLTPQWMTSVAAYGYGVYDLGTQKLSFSEIVIPLVDAITGKETGKTNVFEVSLDKQAGSGWVFEMDPWSFNWVKENASDPNPVKYDSDTGKIEVPCVKTTFILPPPMPPTDVWYDNAILEQVNQDVPIFELAEMQMNSTCP